MLLVSGTVPSPLCSLAHDAGGRPSHACPLRARMCVCTRVTAGTFPTGPQLRGTAEPRWQQSLGARHQHGCARGTGHGVAGRGVHQEGQAGDLHWCCRAVPAVLARRPACSAGCVRQAALAAPGMEREAGSPLVVEVLCSGAQQGTRRAARWCRELVSVLPGGCATCGSAGQQGRVRAWRSVPVLDAPQQRVAAGG